MAKKITRKLKLIIEGGRAVPGQQLGPALGQAGINIGEFVKRFNEETKSRTGELVPTIVEVYEDRSYSMIYKTPPVSALILEALNKEKGSGKNTSSKIGTLSREKLREIAEKKMPDLNANDIDAAMKIIAGSARSMGVDVK